MLIAFCLSSSIVLGSFIEESLEAYLISHNAHITEGHMSPEQRIQFCERLHSYGNIKTILEIGLNAGHSAENFFNNCPNLELFVSFDINMHEYVGYAVDYLSHKYDNRFLFIAGDSAVTVPQFFISHPDQLFDLIYVDGNHTFDYAINDIIKCGMLAHPQTILWVDDYHDPAVQAAVRMLEQYSIIKILNIYNYSGRCWIEAQYTTAFLSSHEAKQQPYARHNLWRKKY